MACSSIPRASSPSTVTVSWRIFSNSRRTGTRRGNSDFHDGRGRPFDAPLILAFSPPAGRRDTLTLAFSRTRGEGTRRKRTLLDEPIDFLHESAPAAAQLFGHPKGLTFLFATEMWERFSYYGMRALLVLYMTKYLLLPGHAEHVAGLGTVRRGLEALFGPLALQPLSSQIYGFYTALVYFTPIFGGLLADRVLGQRRTVVLGAVLMAIGHFMMAVEQLFLFALFLLIIGSGCFKPNISTQVGGLYAPGDHRRDRAYSIFYVGINIGAFLAPLVCGTLGEEVGWHYGFAAAGVGMLIGLSIYLYALKFLPPDQLHARPVARADAEINPPLEGEGRDTRFDRGERGGVTAVPANSPPPGSLSRADLPPTGGGGQLGL